jgi:hypothetical protein
MNSSLVRKRSGQLNVYAERQPVFLLVLFPLVRPLLPLQQIKLDTRIRVGLRIINLINEPSLTNLQFLQSRLPLLIKHLPLVLIPLKLLDQLHQNYPMRNANVELKTTYVLTAAYLGTSKNFVHVLFDTIPHLSYAIKILPSH